MAKLRVVPQAFDDLQSAVQWYEKRSQDAARRFCHAIDDALDDIVANPEGFAKLDDDNRFLLLQRFPY